MTLNRIFDELNYFEPNSFTLSVCICLNGNFPLEAYKLTKEKIVQFANLNPLYPLILLESSHSNKNLAINMLLDHARNKKIDIVHFCDDDIQFYKSSLRKNIQCLIENKSYSNEAVLVGSHYLPRLYSLGEHTQKYNNYLTGAWHYLIQSFLAVPYRLETEVKTISGQSMAAYCHNFPNLPSPTIADDAYFNQYFVYKNIKNIKSKNINPIKKPKNSIIYFDLPATLSEWFKQKVRTTTLVERSARFFGENYEFVEGFFSWPYSLIPKFRSTYSPPDKLSLKFFSAGYSLLLKLIWCRCCLFFWQNKSPKWHTAKSTKPSSH